MTGKIPRLDKKNRQAESRNEQNDNNDAHSRELDELQNALQETLEPTLHASFSTGKENAALNHGVTFAASSRTHDQCSQSNVFKTLRTIYCKTNDAKAHPKNYTVLQKCFHNTLTLTALHNCTIITMDRPDVPETHSCDFMTHGEAAGRRTTTDEVNKNDENRTAKRLCRKRTADLTTQLRAQNGSRISRQHNLDALTSLARNVVQSYSSLSRCSSRSKTSSTTTSALESNNNNRSTLLEEDSDLRVQQAKESKSLGPRLRAACSPFSQSRHYYYCTTTKTRLFTTRVFCKSNKGSSLYDTATPTTTSVDAVYPKPKKRAKIEPDDQPSWKHHLFFALLTSMHADASQIRTQLTVIKKKKETWMKAKETVARFDEGLLLCKALVLDLTVEGLEERTKEESERMDQIRPFLKKAAEVLEGDVHHVVEKLHGVNEDMRHAVEKLRRVTKDVRHVIEELKDLSNTVRLAINELAKLNQCTNFVSIGTELKKMTKDRRLVSADITVMETEMTAAVNLGTAKSWNRAPGLANPKATGGLNAFRRRERRLNAMKVALEQASSMGRPRIKYTAIWTELDEMWHKLMAHEREESFSKNHKCAKNVSDKPIMKTFDADLDKLESWIGVL